MLGSLVRLSKRLVRRGISKTQELIDEARSTVSDEYEIRGSFKCHVNVVAVVE